MQFILKIGEKSGRIMKRVDQNRKSRSRKTAVNTVLIVAAAILLIAGGHSAADRTHKKT